MKLPLPRFVLLALVASGLITTRLVFANTALWQGVSGVSATTNWSDNANWLNIGGGSPGANGNDVLFGNTGAVSTDVTINSVVNTSIASSSMTFTNQSSLFNTVLIPAGITLVNTNALTVGSSPGVDANNTKVNFTGGGTLLQLGNVTVRNNANTSGSTSLATLDLSGLSFFVCSNSGTLNVGGVGSETRSAGQLLLAGASNNLTVTTLNLQTTTGNGGNSGGANLRLGLGTNIINAGTINVVSGKAVSGTLSFQGATGGLRIRGANGNADDTSRGNIVICNRNTGGTGGLTGTADFTGGHAVDVKANTITVGQAGTNPTSATQAGTANLRFDAGTIDAVTVNMAVNSVANASVTANVEVAAGGSLVVSNLSLVNQTGNTATGNLYVGGNLKATAGIIKTTTTGTGNLTITNGMLTLVTGGTIGASGSPIDNVNLASATLRLPVANNVAIISSATLNLIDTASTVTVASLPSISAFPAQFPLISYTTFAGGGSISLNSLPAGYMGYISNDNVSTIWLVVTNGPFVAKADVWTGAANNQWNTNSLNWTNSSGAVSYNDGDIVVFDDSAKTNTVNLTATRLPSSLTVSNSVLNYTFTGSGSIGGVVSLVKNGTASLTLGEAGGDGFSGGIFVNNGTLILDNSNSAISGGLTIATGATAQIGNNSTNGALPGGGVALSGTLAFKRTDDVMVAVGIGGAGNLTQSGSDKLTLSAANTYSGTTTVSGGTLALSGGGNITNSAQVVVTAAALDLSGASGQTLFNALAMNNSVLTLSMPNLQPPLSVASLTAGGAANTVNVTSLPPIGSYPAKLRLVQSASPISGFNFTLGALPAATPAYAGSVAVSADQTAVELTLTAGPVGVRPAVFWTGADVPNLNTNWSDRLNWNLPGAPSFGENVYFDNDGTQSTSALSTPGGGVSTLMPDYINNIVDTSTTISSLTYTNLGGSYHNTLIKSGQTLSLTNAGLAVGAFDTGTAAQGFVTVSGTHASLVVPNTNANVQVWLGNASSSSQATLDMSALDTFNATVSRLLVGATFGSVNRPSGVLYLARTNVISAGFQTTSSESGTATGNASIVVSDCNGNAGSPSYLYLGQANAISANVIGIGRQKASGHLLFNAIYANLAPYPSVTFQGVGSSQVSIFDVGDGVGNTGTTTLSADANLTGGWVTATIDSMNIGRGSAGASGSGTTTGALEFDAGTITVNTLNIGIQPVTGSKIGIGNVGVGSNTVIGAAATLTVSSNLTLGTAVGGTGAAATSGTLGITNGTVLAYNIVPGINGGLSTINLAGGRLVVTNPVGNATTPLATLNLASLGTPDNNTSVLSLPVRTNSAGLTVTTLNLDALDTTTNVINVLSVGPVGATPVELPLISYTSMGFLSGSTFNVRLGTLPSGYTGTLVNDTANSMIALMLTSAIHPQPRVTALSVQSGTNLTLSGVNGFANVPYSVVGTTNLTLPKATWPTLGTGVFGPDGSFSFTTPMSTSQQFFIVRVP
jgi:hypothetical protein